MNTQATKLVTIAIGIGYTKDNKPLAEDVINHELARFEVEMAKAFGGFTKYNTFGGYINKAGRLTKEESIVFQAYGNESQLANIISAIDTIKARLEQETIAIGITDAMFTLY